MFILDRRMQQSTNFVGERAMKKIQFPSRFWWLKKDFCRIEQKERQNLCLVREKIAWKLHEIEKIFKF